MFANDRTIKLEKIGLADFFKMFVMLFQQKVNSGHENIDSHYFRHLVLFCSQPGIIFMLCFIENSTLMEVKHNLKSKPSFK